MGRLVAVMTCPVLSCFGIENASGAEYRVGYERGWTINIEGWTQGKKFMPGDVLIFKYDPLLHNVVAVDLDSYDTCTLGESYKIYESGNDHVVLEKGASFFFSSKDGDCDKKMKNIEVHAWDFPPIGKDLCCLSGSPRFAAFMRAGNKFLAPCAWFWMYESSNSQNWVSTRIRSRLSLATLSTTVILHPKRAASRSLPK